jgi:hypothetical protein
VVSFLSLYDYVSNDNLCFLVDCINFISSHLQYIGCYPVGVSICKFNSQNPQYNMIYPFLMKRQNVFCFQNLCNCSDNIFILSFKLFVGFKFFI